MAAAPASPSSTELAHVRYFIDGSVQEGVKRKLIDLLHAHSAQECRLPASTSALSTTGSTSATSTTNFDLEDVTHIITLSSTFPGYQDVEQYNHAKAEEARAAGREATTAPAAPGQRGELIAVVSPKWLTRTSDLKKRQDEQFYSPDSRMIFSGIVVCTEDLPQGDSETIKGVVAALGGQWRQALMIEVTHLICTKPKGKKFERLMVSGYRLGMKAILPHWFDDCIKLQQRVREDDYLFPEPPCLATTTAKPDPYIIRLQKFLKLPSPPVINNLTTSILDPHASTKETQTYLDALTRKEQILSEDRPAASGVFKGKKVYIAESCSLSAERLQTLGIRIQEAGGVQLQGETLATRLTALQKADYVVTNHRVGWEFWKAYDLKKTIGNLDWLVFVLFVANKSSSVALSSPMDRLLHYPWPNSPLEQFKDFNITISGYAGTARESIKRMIELLGGKFEGTMTKNKTTHVICSTLSGSKVQHAQLWDVPVLNHFWIEDCFLSWSCRNNISSQYVNFEAAGADYASLVGTRTISPKVIGDWANRDEVKAEKARALAEIVTTASNGQDSEMTETPQSNGAAHDNTPPPSRRKKIAAPEAVAVVSESVLRVDTGRPSESAESEQDMPASSTMQGDDTPAKNQEDTLMLNAGTAPQASETAEAEIAAIEKELLEKPARPAKRNSPAAVSTPVHNGGGRVKPPLEPPSSASTVEVAKPEPTKMKRKRSSMSFLQEENSFGFTPQIYSGRKAAAAAQKKLHDTIMPDVNRFAEEQRGGGKKRLDDMFGSAGPSEDKIRKAGSSSSPRRDIRQSSASHGSEDGDQVDDDGLPDLPRSTNGAAKGRQVRIETLPSQAAGPSKAKGRVGALQQIAEPSRSQISSDYSSFDAPPGKKHYPELPMSKVVKAGKTVKIASTGLEIDEGMRRALTSKMKAQLVGSDLASATHVIVKAISRTPKFLQAISMGLYFVTEKWALDSVNNNQFMDEDLYQLKDKEGEAKHGMNLARSLARARQRKVFDDLTFYLTPRVQPAFDALKQIAEAGGAKVIKKLPTLKLVQDKADVYVLSSLEESGSFKHLVDNGVLVYSGEAIIKAALQQTFNFEEYILNAEEEKAEE